MPAKTANETPPYLRGLAPDEGVELVEFDGGNAEAELLALPLRDVMEKEMDVLGDAAAQSCSMRDSAEGSNSGQDEERHLGMSDVRALVVLGWGIIKQ
jgi:hypothetical protein